MAQQRDIKYINREFSDFRQQLIEFAKNYYPDTYNDFSETSPGMMFMEMAAYVGDVLSFYQDTQLQETFLQHAKDPANLYTMAYSMGYRPKATAVSEVELEISQRVDATGTYTPDYSQAFAIFANSTVRASSGNSTQFILNDKVDFAISSSIDPTEVTIFSVDGSNNPTAFTLKKKVKAFSGEIVSITEEVGIAEKFKTITIDDTDIVGILDITDSNGYTWYEVPFLGQDTIFLEEDNVSSDQGLVPTNLTLQKVPRRFVTRLTSQNKLQIQFGSGIIGDNDEDFTPNPTNVGIGTNQGISRIDYAYDPSNFLFTRTYGLAPSNTTLTIRYIRGGGVSSNEPANSITQQVTITTSPTTPAKIGTLEITNPKPATGGRDGDSIEEVRQNSIRAFNEQSRTVTLQDYAIRALSLPSKYGGVSKAYATQDQLSNSQINTDILIDNNPLAISLYVLTSDINGKMSSASTSLKQNLKKYLSQYIMLTDSVNIKDAFIVNIGIQYDIIPLPNSVGRDILLKCNEELIKYFDIRNWSINQPINLATVYTLLDRIKGVQTVQNINIINKYGGNYSEYEYDIRSATKQNVIYPSIDPMVFEVKYPTTDIQGRITTL